MKIKSPSKKAKPSPAVPKKSNSAGKITVCLKPFAEKTPTEILKMVSSLLAPKNSGGAKSLEGLYSGIAGTNFNAPDWVKRASQNLFKTIGFEKMLNSQIEMDSSSFWELLGKTIGGQEEIMNKSISPRLWMSDKEKKIFAPIIQEIKRRASEAEPNESKAFFDARSKSSLTREKMEQPTVLSKIILVLLSRWYQIEEMKMTNKLRSTGDLHKWLLTAKDRVNVKVFPTGIDTRQIRKVCKDIGLEFQNQWRKPKPKI